ncbi:hypothetical protein DNTS_002523 [Danionella cerebrum]|uniref:Uncharacterized protein n=1 Tax=Danionella cerebrum TaxID=2873325 RepID=A0A553MSN0_9TELE|nr:hypothetical protein DNTS_002523 [Danionella translucida]
MKPRRPLDLLPTITELQESEIQPEGLDQYLDSIRELSQPSYPLSGPLQGTRVASPHTAMAHRPWALSGINQDPLDWLFAQAQHSRATLTQNTSEDLGMI